jgi:hypothetical protein
VRRSAPLGLTWQRPPFQPPLVPSTSLRRRRGRGEGEAGQRERGYKHGYGSWTRTVERVPRSRTRRIEPNPGSNSWIELVDTQRSRRMVQDGDWNPSNPPREGEWRSRAPASFAPQCSVRRPCHLVVSLSFSLSSVSSNRLAPSDAGAYESVCRERVTPRPSVPPAAPAAEGLCPVRKRALLAASRVQCTRRKGSSQ